MATNGQDDVVTTAKKAQQRNTDVEDNAKKLQALTIDLKFQGRITAKIVLQDLKDDFRHKVWSMQYPEKNFDSGTYSKWIMSTAHQEDEVVPFVNNLLPQDCKQRALLTWRTLRALSRTTSLSDSYPTFGPDLMAFAVKTTEKYDAHDIPFGVYEMVLFALGRKDVLEYMQREEMQWVNAI